MSTPLFLTFDGDGVSINPYRPGISDVGGASKLDDADFPPDPVTMFTAADFNEMSMLFVALAKVAPVALIYVSNSGTPTVSALRAAGSVLQPSDITVVSHATGDTELTCPATKIIQPFAAMGFTQAAGDYRVSARVNGTSNGIRVETRGGSGALTAVDFFAIWV